ncbi:RDD family protein [Myroides sp. WP-1]|uniref:RDD family protein n=1 Tax=Myroides sp. WP-1 TaxID=2759944 RepID=UPI0015FD9AAE|nr:RDD family protein [Myroides sp. WP-1]MBB1138978.1 RDD family protein [Myroides sp. WP-1]
MERKFFIVRNDQKYGPYTKEELVGFVITPDTLVWYEGLPDWTEAKNIEELSDLFQYPIVTLQNKSVSSIPEERIGNIVYHADQMHVTLYTPQGEIYYRYADFGDRFVGLLLDRLICLFLSFLPIIGPWLYYAILHSSADQATVGQRVMNIKCLSDEGNTIDFGQATGRFFMSIVSSLIFCIGYFLYFGNSKKQTLHDSVAKTIVVKEIGRKEYNF